MGSGGKHESPSFMAAGFGAGGGVKFDEHLSLRYGGGERLMLSFTANC